MKEEKRDLFNCIIILSFLLFCRIVVRNVNGQQNDLCLTVTLKIEYYDQHFKRIFKEREETRSSEAFQKQVESWTKSVNFGVGGNLGIKMFDIGVNYDVGYSWGETLETEYKKTNYRNTKETDELEFNEDSRQLYKETTTYYRVERQGRRAGFSAPLASHETRKYIGAIDRKLCPGYSQQKLDELAKRDIKNAAMNKNVNISLDGKSITETKCGRDGTNITISHK